MEEIFKLLESYQNIVLAGVIAGIVTALKTTGLSFLNWGKYQGIMALVIALGYFLIDYFIPAFGDPTLTFTGAILWALGTGLMATGWHSQIKNTKQGIKG